MKYIFTENQVKKIIDSQINEQSEEAKYTVRIQNYLNDIFKNTKGWTPLKVDGMTGPESQTGLAIQRLQKIIGVTQDGVWGPETERRLEEKRPDLYKVWKDKYKPGFFSDWF